MLSFTGMAASGSRALSVRKEENASVEGEESVEVRGLTTRSALKSRVKYKSKRVKQAVSKRGRGSDLNPALWSHLPGNLKQNIFSRLPFHNLFQAATLSKKWKLRVICSRTFQSAVQKNLTPSTWGSYGPLFVNQKKEIVGYACSSGRWHRLPSQSYIEEHDLTKNWTLTGAAGTLLCWTTNVHIVVTNPLTRRWKRLKSPPNMDLPRIVHVVCEENKAYKVILLTVDTQETPPHSVYVISQIFDSTTNTWTVDVYNSTKRNITSQYYGSACVSGVLYLLLLGRQPRDLGHLISFDVKKKTWNGTPLRHYLLDDHCLYLTVDAEDHRTVWDNLWDMFFCDTSSAQVVVCGSKVYLVIRCNCADVDKLCVFRLYPELTYVLKVARAPEEIFRTGVGEHGFIATGQGDNIMIINPNLRTSLLLVRYNVITEEWHREIYGGLFTWDPETRIWRHPLIGDTGEGLWRSITYEPGLNPFCEV